MYQQINSYDINAHLESNYDSTLKLEVKLSNLKVIPAWSWVDEDVAAMIPHNTACPAFYSETTCYWYIRGTRYYSTEHFSNAALHDDVTRLNWYLAYGDQLPISPSEVRILPTEYKT